MIIGILKETLEYEQRVAATPATVKQLIKSDHSVIIENDAGEGSFISNEDFKNAGAEILESATDIYNKSEIIFKVNPPSENELELLNNGSTIISFFQI